VLGVHDGDLLRRVDYLAGASDASIDHLTAHSQRRRLDRGEFLFHEADPCTGCWVIVSGAVVAERLSPEGGRLILHVAGPFETPGYVDVVRGTPRMVSARAVAATELITLTRSSLTRVLETDLAVTLAMLHDVVGIVARLDDIASDLAFANLSQRLAKFLLESAPEHADLTQREIAARLAAARQSVNVALGAMVRGGLVRLGATGKVDWIDVEGLAELVKSPRP
jgi:CRP-like cAMP-binding protein